MLASCWFICFWSYGVGMHSPAPDCLTWVAYPQLFVTRTGVSEAMASTITMPALSTLAGWMRRSEAKSRLGMS